MATAYIKRINGEYMTEVRNSEGKLVKIVPTHPSQIRKSRPTCLWTVTSGLDTATSVKAQTMLETTKLK